MCTPWRRRLQHDYRGDFFSFYSSLFSSDINPKRPPQYNITCIMYSITSLNAILQSSLWVPIRDFWPIETSAKSKMNGTMCDPFFGSQHFFTWSVPELLRPLWTCRRIDTDCVVTIFISGLKRVSFSGVQYVYAFFLYTFKQVCQKKTLLKVKKSYYYVYNICNNFFCAKKNSSDCWTLL